MDFNARLIDSISSREPLYNQYHVDYKNRIKTDQLWKDVAMDVEASGLLLFHFSSDYRFHIV